MLEILLVIGLCKLLGKILRAKGRNPFWIQFMLVVTWILGQITGGFVAGLLHVIRNGEDAPLGIGVYLFGIAGGAIGCGLTFLVAHLLPPLHPESQRGIFSDDTFEHRRDPDNPYAT